jgi:hypothetical protein
LGSEARQDTEKAVGSAERGFVMGRIRPYAGIGARQHPGIPTTDPAASHLDQMAGICPQSAQWHRPTLHREVVCALHIQGIVSLRFHRHQTVRCPCCGTLMGRDTFALELERKND